MEAPLYIESIPLTMNFVLNLNDPLMDYLVEQYDDDNLLVLIFKFPESFILNLDNLRRKVNDGEIIDFDFGISVNGTKTLKVYL